MKYTIKDKVLPLLSLPDPCPVSITDDEKHVNLKIGPRDWSWDKKTGELVAAGTDVRKL
jgi:hypothetical protein